MTLAAAMVSLWHRVHFYKVLVFLILALLTLQYLSGIIDRRSIQTVFTGNASKFLNHSYKSHARGLIIYEPVTSPNYLVNASNVSVTTAPSPNNFSKTDLAPTELLVSSTKSTQQARNVSLANVTDASAPPLCPLEPPGLVGALKVESSPPSFEEMEKVLVDVKLGGIGSPSNCTARSRVAIIVPFRDRLEHLRALLYNLHPMLLRQQIDYQIFIIEQGGSAQFNRATLMNVGYVEALKEKLFDCFIFHDVDLLPENDKNLYNCPEQPRHMSVAIDKFKYKLPYLNLFGGVSALTRQHFSLVNGFSNAFWGWGGEDDDMANRIKAHHLHIARYPASVARYKMLTHKKEKANPKRYEFLRTGKKRQATDGLSNLKYELVEKKKWKLYTWLLIKLTPPQLS